MVGLVVVSHSELIARGVIELCRQMAPNVAMAAAGGRTRAGLVIGLPSVIPGAALV